jgi:DNA-binding transcriptional MerR regulator
VPQELTIDELAATTGATTRSIRSFQSMGLLPPPALRGRTGLYSRSHVERLAAILRLQAAGFALQSLAVLFAAHARGDSLGEVLGLRGDDVLEHERRVDTEDEGELVELYGFADLQYGRRSRRTPAGRPLLSVVPTTVWNETEAS